MDNRELLIRAKNGDKNARETLVDNNIRLVHSIVNRFTIKGFEREDLFQIGCVGLIKAIDKFELALFDKYYDILYEPMKTYYSDLEAEYLVMINQDASSRSSDYSLRISQIQQQMWNVSRVLNAKNLDEIMSVVSSYIYLKKQIEWK